MTRLPLLILLAQEPDAVFKVETRVVNITFSAAGARDGNFIPDLRQEEIAIREDGKPRPPAFFAKESDLPLTLGIIVDLSGSQRGLFRRNRREALEFLRGVLKAKDQVFVVTFGEGLRLVQDLTGDVKEIEETFGSWDDSFADATRWSRRVGSPVYSSIMQSLKRKMAARPGRKAILMISDGIDTRSTDEPNDVTEKLQSTDTMLYWLRTPNMQRNRSGLNAIIGGGKDDRQVKRLRRVADESGGRSFEEATLADQFKQIELELRTQYAIGFSPSRAPDGKLHKLELKSTRPNVRLRHKPAYRDEP